MLLFSLQKLQNPNLIFTYNYIRSNFYLLLNRNCVPNNKEINNCDKARPQTISLYRKF